jgi:hypothetical protein
MKRSSVADVLRVLEATKMGEWRLPFDWLASRLREIFGLHQLDYVDLGKTKGFPLTVEVFAITDKELTFILFRRLFGATALAVGNVTEGNRGLAEKIWEEMRRKPVGPVRGA